MDYAPPLPTRQDWPAEVVPEATSVRPPAALARALTLIQRFGGFISLGVEWITGLLTLLVALAALSVVPVVNLLSLGYLLEASSRVAKTGRFRDGFVGVRQAAGWGRVLLATWLVLWPARFFYGLWRDAELVAAGSGVARGWRWGFLLVALASIAHIAWACLRGGKLRHFLWPAPLRFWRWLRGADSLEHGRGLVTKPIAKLRLGHYFRLGWLGFLTGLLWLIVPVSLLFAGSKLPPGGGALLGLMGSALLFVVAFHLPFLQTLAARDHDFSAGFDWRRLRDLARRAPWAFTIALAATLLGAIPLYLLKIEFPPREITWLPSLFFVVFLFPARLLTGWAIHRAQRKEQPAHWFWRWTARLGSWPVVAFYVLVVYLTPYLTWHGALSLLDQHAFLVPATFLNP